MVFLSLGSNLGDRHKNLMEAVTGLSKLIKCSYRLSGIYETEPLGVTGHPDYLNAVMAFDSDMGPEALFSLLTDTEARMGRQRRAGLTEPRNIDIDILFYYNLILQTEILQIPHPQIIYRKFVLRPFIDIAPDFQHPVYKQSMMEIYNNCNDSCRVELYNKERSKIV